MPPVTKTFVQATFVQATFVLATFVHIRNSSAVTDQNQQAVTTTSKTGITIINL